jgi:hypothetical protein
MSSQEVSRNQKEHSVLTHLASLEFSLKNFDNPTKDMENDYINTFF